MSVTNRVNGETYVTEGNLTFYISNVIDCIKLFVTYPYLLHTNNEGKSAF